MTVISDRFTRLLQEHDLFLTEGAIIERIRRETDFPLDPHVLNAGFIYDPDQRILLKELYTGYIDAGREAGLPMLLLAPTWRATPPRLFAAGLPEVKQYSLDAISFMRELQNDAGNYGEKLLVGGLTGPKGDAYDSRDGIPTHEAVVFHTEQIQALAAAGVDYFMAATLPTLPEAIGIAQAMASTGIPYIISFVLRPTGSLFDGAPLQRAIDTIDNAVSPAPYGYMGNCVHPRNFNTALEKSLFIPQPDLADTPNDSHLPRIIGLQANTSDAPHEELNDASSLLGDDPDKFTNAMLDVVISHPWMKIFGGCCGSNNQHILMLGEKLHKC